MKPYTVICVKLNTLDGKSMPYCFRLGFIFDGKFEKSVECFNSKKEFDQYRGTLIDIFEPHERPTIIFI